MQGSSRTLPTVSLLVAALLCATAQARACAFDGLLGSGLTAQHPRSIAVALAIRDAIDQGTIGAEAATSLVTGSSGYWRAVGRLKALQQPLSVALGRSGGAISILLVDSNLWARIGPSHGGPAMEIHTPAAQQGDAVILTSQAVLAAAIEGRLTTEAALSRGLIALDADPDAEASIRSALQTAFMGPGTSNLTARPVGLFGPGRTQSQATERKP